MLTVERASAIDLIGDAAKYNSATVNIAMPAPKTKLIPAQVISAKRVGAPKIVAFTLGFAGGASLGYGLTSLLMGNTANNLHNKAIITGGALLGVSLPIAMIGSNPKEKKNTTPHRNFYQKPVIQPQLCVLANKNGLGLALNF